MPQPASTFQEIQLVSTAAPASIQTTHAPTSENRPASENRPTASPAAARRSSRLPVPPRFFDPGVGPANQWRDNDIASMAQVIEKSSFPLDKKHKIYCALSKFDIDISSSRHSPLCYKTQRKHDPDLPTHKEANVFAQTDLPSDSEVHIEAPPCFSTEGDQVFKLNKSLSLT